MLARMVGKKLFSHLYFRTFFGVDIASSFVFFFSLLFGWWRVLLVVLCTILSFSDCPLLGWPPRISSHPPLTIWWSMCLECHFCPLQTLRLGFAFRLLQVSFSVLTWTMDGRTSSLGNLLLTPQHLFTAPTIVLSMFGMLSGRNQFCPLWFGFQGLFFL